MIEHHTATYAERSYSGKDFADLTDDEICNAFVHEKTAKDVQRKTESPRPLYRDLPPAAPFPLEALGPVLAPAAQAIEQVIQCPMACAANSVLSVASLAAQGRANAILPIGEGKITPLSLFILTMLESGERKSSADSMALKPVREMEQQWASEQASERASYDASLSAYEANRKHITTKLKADQAALKAALEDLGPPPIEPLLSVIAPSGDQTMEGLFRIYQHGRPSLAMLCDDAATFLGGHSLKAEQKSGTTANLCRAWDGAKLERIRGGDGVTVLYDRRLASHLMMQPGVAAGFMSDRQFADQGLLARFLVSAPAARAGTRIRDDSAYQAIVTQAARNLEDYNRAVSKLLDAPIRWKDENDRTLGVELNALQFTTEARALYVEFCNSVEAEMAPKGQLATIKPFASKLAEQTGRIAGILALMEDQQASHIETDHLKNGIRLAQYYLSEAIRLTASGAIDPDLREAEELRLWLLEQDQRIISTRSVYQFGPGAIRSASKARAALEILQDHGWVVRLPDGAEIAGKHCREAWKVVTC